MYQDLCGKANDIIREDTCMKFSDTSKPLNLETDASGIGIGTGLLQVRNGMSCRQDEVLDNTALCPTVFASKILSSMECQ